MPDSDLESQYEDRTNIEDIEGDDFSDIEEDEYYNASDWEDEDEYNWDINERPFTYARE